MQETVIPRRHGGPEASLQFYDPDAWIAEFPSFSVMRSNQATGRDVTLCAAWDHPTRSAVKFLSRFAPP